MKPPLLIFKNDLNINYQRLSYFDDHLASVSVIRAVPVLPWLSISSLHVFAKSPKCLLTPAMPPKITPAIHPIPVAAAYAAATAAVPPFAYHATYIPL